MKKKLFKIQKDGFLYTYTQDQLKKILEVEYIDHLSFDNMRILEKVQKRCIRAGKDGELTREQIWYGYYYENEIKSNFVPKVLIKWINPIMEFGLFADADLPKNSYIGEYTGIVRKYIKRVDDRNAYCFDYTIGYKKTPFTIDAREKGSLIRFVNHSFKSNLTPISVIFEGILHIIFRTNRAIKKNEELTYDYGPNYWKHREKPR